MATSKTTQKRTIKKSTMKITPKRRKRSTKALKLKVVKFDRALKKMRLVAKRTLKNALKGVPNVRTSIYNKIDRNVAKEITTLIETAVVNSANDVIGTAKPKTPRKPRAKKEPAAKTPRKPRAKKTATKKAAKVEE